MIISDKYQFVYIDIPKTASTSLDKLFERHYGGRRFVTDPKFKKHSRTIPYSAKNYLRIVSVRNPYFRIASHYQHYLKYWKHGPDFRSFLEFVEYSEDVTKTYPANIKDTDIYRFFPCWKYVKPIGYDIVLHTESLDTDILKIPFISEATVPKLNTEKYNKEALLEDKNIIKLITSWAGEDFERFGYSVWNNH